MKVKLLIIFITGLIIRLLILFNGQVNNIVKDSPTYHNMAINIIRGNGFSMESNYPYHQFFFREPGYPIFLASAYYIIDKFQKIDYINNQDLNKNNLKNLRIEILILKLIQVLVDSSFFIFLFYLLKLISNEKIAFYVSILGSIFPNFAFYSTTVYREPITNIFLILLSLIYLFYIQKNFKVSLLIVIASLISILIYIVKFHIILLIGFSILSVINLVTKQFKFKMFLLHNILLYLMVFILTLPYSIYVYQKYPDLRIFMSFGNSYTSSMREYDIALHRLLQSGQISKNEQLSNRVFFLPFERQFELSFNGELERKADSLTKINIKPKEYYLLKDLVTATRKSFFLTRFGYNDGIYYYNHYGWWTSIFIFIIPFIIGIFGILGLIFNYKLLRYLFPFFSYLIFFWLLGDEYRRMIFLQPFLIYFGVNFYVSNFRSFIKANYIIITNFLKKS